MRLLPLLALTGAAVAQQGQPGMMDKLNAWVANFKLQISNLVPSSIDAGASAIAGQVVQPLTLQNWKAHVGPKPHEPEEWLVFITGGNKTCFGRCDHVDATWNKSVAALTALPKSPAAPTLRLGRINCEDNEILCTSWSAGVPALWHFLPSTEEGKTTDIRIFRLNATRATTDDIVSIPSSSKSRYLEREPYEGALHPIDGTLQKFGLMTPFGVLLWILGAVPSWAMMLVISFASRSIMNKRLNNPNGLGAPPAAPGQPAAQAPPAAAAGRASPAGKGSKKKR